jgi:Tol biopolymer transport system component
MGEVYRATDSHLKRSVAIKVLPASVAGDTDRLARFQREAEVLAALNHPNIAAIYGLEKTPDLTALVMELVEGEDLSVLIARGPIPLADALPLARQIADALEAAHEQGIIHRDLKPANVKIRADGTVKVLDFGLAKAMDPVGTSSGEAMNSPTMTARATQMGMILGTAAYMSPEQARGKAVDRRADIWAFGVVLYELLSGRRAFEGDDISITLASVLKEDVKWEALPADLPASVRRALRRCLEKDPKRRLSAIGDARLELDEAALSPREDRVGPLSSAPAASRGQRALPWSLAALAMIAALAFAVAHLRERPKAAEQVRFSVAPPVGATRRVDGPFAVSPDGRTMAFLAVVPGNVRRLFTRRIDEGEAKPVAGTDNARAVFWSPDSRSLGFITEGGLYRTELDGAAPRRLCDVQPGEGRSLSGTWGRGVIVYASGVAGLWRVADTGGTPSPVTSLDTTKNEVSHRSPWFLPDGRHVLFLALGSGQITGVIWAVSIDDPARTRIAESTGGAAYADGWLLTTTSGARSLVAQPFDPARLTLAGAAQPVRDRLGNATNAGVPGFSVSASALAVERPPPIVHQLTWMDREGRVVGTVGPAKHISDFALAPDERRVAAGISDPESLRRELWLFGREREDGIRLTFGVDARRPMWDQDGRHVYFTTNPNFELWSLTVGSTEPKRFDNPGRFSHFEDVTRDGRYLVLKALAAATPSTVWVQRVGVPAERRALIQGQFAATQARVSPDGRWVAYTLVLPGGAEVFIQPFNGPGERTQISRTGGIGAIWRGDGRELYFEAPDGLMAVAMTEGAGALDVGTPRKLFALHTQGVAPNAPHNVEVAANGQKFLVNTIVGDSDNVPIEVTLNWTNGLTK